MNGANKKTAYPTATQEFQPRVVDISIFITPYPSYSVSHRTTTRLGLLLILALQLVYLCRAVVSELPQHSILARQFGFIRSGRVDAAVRLVVVLRARAVGPVARVQLLHGVLHGSVLLFRGASRPGLPSLAVLKAEEDEGAGQYDHGGDADAEADGEVLAAVVGGSRRGGRRRRRRLVRGASGWGAGVADLQDLARRDVNRVVAVPCPLRKRYARVLVVDVAQS